MPLRKRTSTSRHVPPHSHGCFLRKQPRRAHRKSHLHRCFRTGNGRSVLDLLPPQTREARQEAAREKGYMRLAYATALAASRHPGCGYRLDDGEVCDCLST